MDGRLGATESSSDSEDIEQATVLNILIDKHEAVEQSVSVLKKGIVTELPQLPITASLHPDSTNESIKADEIDGLSNLLTDSRVQAMIKSVAGANTRELIGAAVAAVKSSNSEEEKQKVFSNGIKKLHSNFVVSPSSFAKDDKTLDLALSLVGLNKVRLGGFGS